MPISKFLFASFLDFLFPPVCLSCDASLEDGSVKICFTCWNSIARLSRSHPLYLDTKGKLTENKVVADLVSCYVFEKEGAFQKIAHELKYGGFQVLGVELGRRIGAAMNEWQIRADVVIPIPLHRRKFRERGYNQAEAIARGIAEATSIPLQTNLIRRRKFTETQTQLNLEQRKENMEDAFELNANRTNEVKKNILLVDDVITTGATIVSCAQELLNAGAASIIAASAALAQKDVA